MNEAEVRARLRKIEALFARPGSAGERLAAEAVSERFVDETLWPEFTALNRVLVDYLSQVTERIIREEVFAQTAEAEEIDEPKRLPA